MKENKKLRNEIAAKVKEYYQSFHQKPKFSAGISKINYAGRHFDEQDMVSLMDAALDFWLTHGKESQKFEKDLADFLNVKYCLMVNSGSSANLLAFMALTSPLLKDRKINRGDEVITVAACFPTTVAPIIQYGAIPVFVDINSSTLNIDEKLLAAALSKKTKAVMLAHTLGNPFNLTYIRKFCDKNNLWLIEDNCDSLGSTYNNQLTGSIGDIGTSSFYPPHHITTGEGGAVYTNNPLLNKIMASMRDWGRDCWCNSGFDNTCKKRFTMKMGDLPSGYDHKYIYSHFGYNLKATDLQAAIGITQLKKLPEFIKLRKRNMQIYFQKLNKFKDIFDYMVALPQSDPSWFGFHFILKEGLNFSRNELAMFLEDSKIQTRNLFAGNIIKHPCFQSLKKDQDYIIASDLKNTDSIMNNGFWLGVYPGITEEMINYSTSKIEEFLGTKGYGNKIF